MEGLYLYCIREKTERRPSSFSIKGIAGKEEVFVISYRELEIVVSRVSLEEYGSEAIQIKAQEDLSWIKEKAVIHENIIEAAMENNGKILSLIPMKFGIIFKEEASLIETLSRDYQKIQKVIEGNRGKQEWSVKAYLKDKRIFERMVKEKNETIKEKERKMAALPEGMAFFMEQELNQAISEELNKELDNIAERLFDNMKKQAVGVVKNKILGKELIGKPEPMVFNAACLISEEKNGAFEKEAQRLNQEIQAKGLYLEYSGPWPAYNFTNY